MTRFAAARFALLGLAVLAIVAGGCRFFRPAQAEIPEGGVEPIELNYTTIENTLETIRLAIQDKSTTNGQSAYIQAFADPTTDGVGFTAEFDPITAARFPGQSTEWNIDREELFYSNLSRVYPTSQFTFAWGDFRGAPDDDETSVPAVIYRSYLLLATPDEGQTFVNVARGNAALYFIQVGTQWKIVKWIDSEDPLADFDADELSFGQLRLAGP